ncbi:RnfABCDGE type electron transport complex subunit D [uncultured Subdoligranulum sp.]|uniref:RnfABCDGE type electron transport complex subunit D n=1 Tax=uncultured Subdoligranulum sp. TaxID=512298 RepID=UPI002607A09B|nr:RnfABCDGE type electron transport complex subunit D [uncultured Subdoligranulum sp.]
MPNHMKIEHSENYDYYRDLLWCAVPLAGMAWYYYGPRPVLLLLAGLLTAYLCDCALAPLHGAGYHPHEPSSECFAALIVLMMPATVPYAVVVAAVIAAVLVKEAFGGEGHYPFHPAAVGMAVAGISWPGSVYSYPTPGSWLPVFGSITDVTMNEGMNATLRDGGLPSASTMNLLTGNVPGGLGTSAILVIVACGLFLLVRGHVKTTVLVPFLIFCIGLPWLLPQLNELPVFSWPWEFIRQRIYLEKYVILSGTVLFGGLFLICEPVTMPNRTSSRILYGAALGIATHAFRVFSPYESAVCFALLIVSAIPEWLDLVSHRTERIRFMRKEERRLAQFTKPE